MLPLRLSGGCPWSRNDALVGGVKSNLNWLSQGIETLLNLKYIKAKAAISKTG